MSALKCLDCGREESNHGAMAGHGFRNTTGFRGTPTPQRNPEATCGSEKFPCPYWEKVDVKYFADCIRLPAHEYTSAAFSCGEHPNFWQEGEPK
jgi:hypothetical protein